MDVRASVFVVAAALCVASPAWAEVRVTLSAVDPQAAREADGLSAKEATKAAEARHLKRQAIAKETASRLQARLDAAGFRHATAQAVGGVGEVLVVVYDREATRGWVERVVFGEGELALRPVLAYGELWGSLEGGLPEGLEVRGEGAQAYVYGLDAGAMVELAGRLALADASVHVAPSGPGWKLVALGASVASHRDVSGVKLGRGRLGGSYVTMRLSGAASARWSGGEAREWAVVLDGEVVTLSPRPSAERSRELLVMCPKAAHSDRECASQIAGRAAAHIPVVLMPASGRGSEGDE